MLMKVNDKKLTPQLRFPEFKNSGEWEEKKLGEISNIVKEINRDEEPMHKQAYVCVIDDKIIID